jgi:hypothetical protein
MKYNYNMDDKNYTSNYIPLSLSPCVRVRHRAAGVGWRQSGRALIPKTADESYQRTIDSYFTRDL